MNPNDQLPYPVLIGDIGGTNARFSLVADAEGPVRRFPDAHTGAFATIDDAIGQVLAGEPTKPRAAVLALAGPIAGDRVPLTNSDWVVEPKRLIGRFGLSDVILLNDFEAQSLALPGLGPDDINRIGGGTIEPDSTCVVLGPGTGLGAGALVHARGVWIPVPGEGGHVDMGPVTDRDMAIWPHMERLHGRITGETLLCGPGLLRLYHAIAATDGRPATQSTPAEVTETGLAGSDPLAVEALNLFAIYLGRLAGDLALIFMPRGGVYLGGGIPVRIASVLQSGGFREAFVAKEPHREIMERIATAIVAKTDPALFGIAAFVRAPSRFSVELRGRHWRP